MIKEINGVQRNLGLMDFCVDKLSSRMAVMVFDSFTMSKKKVKDVNNVDVETYVFSVSCTNTFNNRQIKVDVAYVTENKVILEEAERKKKANIFEKVFIDFEDCVLGHYRSGSGDFSQVAQTYKAERVKILSNDEAQAIFRKAEAENNVTNIADQIKNEKQQHK